LSEQPVHEQPVTSQPDERPTPEDWAQAVGRDDRFVATGLPRRRSTVVIKADLLPAVSVASTAAVLGLPLAWIWSRIAPAIPGVLNTSGQPVPLPSPYGYHRFDDLAIFLLIGLGAGIATGVAMWMLRERRGPVILVAGVIGAFVAAWLAMHTGLSFAAGHYALSTAPKAGSVFNIAPRLESGWGVLAQPLGTALAYGVLAAWNGTNDLGRRFS
jgi:uncharacterized membrane protein YeaQ/YmgE (transglycosylase-associated protein family)